MTTFGVVLLKVYCSRCYSVVVETPPCGEDSILYQQYIKYYSIFDGICQEKKRTWRGLDQRLKGESLWKIYECYP